MPARKNIKEPLFSVIIPTYNRATILQRTIQGVLQQSFVDFELIVIDDGSSDNTGEIVAEISDERVRYVPQKNKGRSAARNAGAVMANGHYVTFLDSDDEALPEWLNSLALSIQTDAPAMICCGTQIIASNNDKPIEVVLPRQFSASYADQKVLFYPPGTFTVRRDIFHAVGGYVESLAQGENTELGRRLVSYCTKHQLRIASISRPLILYHRDRTFDSTNQTLFRNYLQSATYMLQYHAEALRSTPHRYALTCGIAGVNSARLGEYSEARRFFVMAIRSDPFCLKHYVRLLLAFIPSLGQKLWLRHG